ncbi:UNVERIFIED_CONTAM: DENN domain-containing protein 5B [Sesamum radiatum]|uniref:DENN domain-containing protein 5B n=1 Tax=Sesamum radiatum TaxID=300843 RepID=A0AAW2KPI2_SESRA
MLPKLAGSQSCKEPSKLFESVVILGLPPNSDVEALQSMYFARKFEGSGRFRNAICGQNQSRIEPNLEPQVLFVYPPEKQLPLKHKDLLSFCFPAGVEVNAVERTPSMSELNEILLGQEHLKQSDLSFVFRLQHNVVPYPYLSPINPLHHGVMMLSPIDGFLSDLGKDCPCAENLINVVFFMDFSKSNCLLAGSSAKYAEIHLFACIFIEERLERVTKQISDLDFESPVGYSMVETSEEKASTLPQADGAVNMHNGTVEASKSSTNDTISGSVTVDISLFEPQNLNRDSYLNKVPNGNDVLLDPEKEKLASGEDPVLDSSVNENFTNKQSSERCSSDAVLPLLQYQQYDNLESSSSFQSSSSENRHFRSDLDEIETERSSSGRDIISAQSDVLEWAKAHNALIVEEEAAALSAWAVACLCGSLPLEHVLTLFAGALLEKQIVVVCSNLGILSALVLSIIPLIRPYQWQSLLMPVLPNDMLDFLDAPVPYIVGVKTKTTELQSKLTNVILVDANRNQVKSPTIPQLPQHKELYSCLSPYHEKLWGESYLGKKRPVYECTDVQFGNEGNGIRDLGGGSVGYLNRGILTIDQMWDSFGKFMKWLSTTFMVSSFVAFGFLEVEAVKGFLGVIRSYLDSLCSNLRSHTITNVQSNDDKLPVK